jgi:hypothetical protein
MAEQLQLKWSLVPPHVKNPNRAERAIRTAKNHVISSRAGFHPDCPAIFLDRCFFQIELTLNIIRPFDYDPTISAYEGIMGKAFDFLRHPIAPVGTKILTWDSPDHRGTWADHGVPAVYLGAAPDHLRAFEVWVPNTSALRITNTVWWFLHDVSPDVSLLESNTSHAYLPTKDRPDPQLNGADLIGRVFMEPDIGVCLITALGPVVRHQLATRAQLQRQKQTNDPLLSQGNHFTLMYTQTSTGDEHFSSVAEILYWIATGPVLQPCESLVPTNSTNAPIMTPPFTPATVQYVPTQTTLATGPVTFQKARDPSQRMGTTKTKKRDC